MSQRTNIIIAVAVAVAIVGGGLWFAKGREEAINSKTPLTKAESGSALSFDTDGDQDGLTDWEEALWETDPKNPDTDGDGTPDGEEADAKRDPKKAGPDDRAAADEVIAKAAEDDGLPLTATEKFSREFFAKYIELRQSGIELTDETVNQIASELFEEGFGEALVSEYTQSDLLVSGADGAAAFREYGNLLGGVIARNEATGRNEIEIIQDFKDNQDSATLKELPAKAERYAKMTREMAAIPVPAAMSGLHLELVNALNGLAVTIKAMGALATDPVGSIPLMSIYPEYVNGVVGSLDAYKLFYSARNVSFSPSEPGYILTL